MRASAGLGLVLLIVFAAITVQAQSGDYRRLVREALMEFEAGRWDEAYNLFRQAHQLAPSARTLRGMGMVSYELGDYPQALSHLQAALESTTRPLNAEQREQVEGLLERARRLVGTLEVSVTPAEAQVLVGKSVVAEREIPVSVGKVTVRAEMPGYAPVERVVTVRGGERYPVRLDLTPIAPRVASPAVSDTQSGEPAMVTMGAKPRADDGASIWSSPWFWTGVGAVLVGGIVTAVVVAGSSASEPGATLPEGNVGVAFSALTGN